MSGSPASQSVNTSVMSVFFVTRFRPAEGETDTIALDFMSSFSLLDGWVFGQFGPVEALTSAGLSRFFVFIT